MRGKVAAGLSTACLAAVIFGAIAQAAWPHDVTAQPSAGPRRSSDPASFPEEAPFLSENTVAMDRMMAGMAVAPTGDVDADFAAMMIPHHQGAIDMALAELRHGRNEQLRRIAQEIIVDQQQEIAAMRLALGQPLPPSAPAPTQVSSSKQPPSRDVSTHNHGSDHSHLGR